MRKDAAETKARLEAVVVTARAQGFYAMRLDADAEFDIPERVTICDGAARRAIVKVFFRADDGAMVFEPLKGVAMTKKLGALFKAVQVHA